MPDLDITSPEFCEQLFGDLKAHAHCVAKVEVGLPAAMALVAAVQLALAHPAFRQTETADLAASVVHEIGKAVALTPALAAVIEAGWRSTPPVGS